jgi:hypothetical protein
VPGELFEHQRQAEGDVLTRQAGVPVANRVVPESARGLLDRGAVGPVNGHPGGLGHAASPRRFGRRGEAGGLTVVEDGGRGVAAQ